MNDLTTIKNEIQSSISDFNEPFTNYLVNLGLPVEGILAPIEERQIVINSIESEIQKISVENRQFATYLTRFLSSVAAGLFDGAVTYLWNETIKSLRKMIVNFDLDYFLKVSSELNNRYKNLRTEDDLSQISDFDLLHACNRMGLITDHVFEVFKFINYMRNHSSAAHPNDSEISAFDLLSWLNNCIKYAINATPNEEAVKLKQLLYNMRTSVIPESDFKYIGESIAELPKVMIEDFLSTIFGMYTDSNINTNVSSNIEGIARYVWNLSSEPKKHSIGEKFGYFRKNGDVTRKGKANDFLLVVDGLSYKDEDSIAQEIRDSLANLMTTHNSINNFYNEEPWARQLKTLLPISGNIPQSILSDWVKTIVICYSGNGNGYREGVDEGALPYYKEFIKNFDNKALVCLLNLMDDPILLMDLDTPKANRRFKKLCAAHGSHCKNVFIVNALNYLATCSEPLSKVHKTTAFKDLLSKVNSQF